MKKERGSLRNGTPSFTGKQKRRRRPFGVYLFIMILVLAVAMGYVYSQLQPPSASAGKVKLVSIPAGSSVRDIGQILEKEGLIKNATLFSLYVKTRDNGSKLQAGDYRFSVGQPISALIDDMAGGKVVVDTVHFTVPEGWNINQIATSLAEKGIVNKEAFLKEIDHGDFSEFPFVSSIPHKEGRKYRLEGYLFPDTYEVKKGATEHEIISKMLAQFQKELKPEWLDELKKQNISLDDAVTLASIVEREVVVDQERPVVAGVFYNRIHDHWMLQSCATIQFILGKQRDRITFNDLKIPSPYNTYLHQGLPPGPIANPGRASLQAVVEPAHHDYFFFVTKKDGTSEHYFSKTLEEHLARDAKSRGNW
ncbi:endolytic transglycosylase MltG [Brevibacillus ginsengisoli]|uniref:endolytic transglycosylase MltG n=1 Tax=Brevibacillus ginsengisoli TaxID=363854 RepID=UPI003CE76F56